MSSDILARLDERLDAFEQKLAERLTPPAVAKVAVGEIWPLLKLACEEQLASWRDHAQRWRDHVQPVFGHLVAAEITVGHVDEYRAARRRAGAAIATINREIALLRRLLNFAVRRGKLDRSPLHGPGMTSELIHREHNVRTTIVEDDPRRKVTLQAFLQAADLKLRAFILLVHRSGMRRAEASRLLLDRIDWEGGCAWVPSEDTKGGEGGRVVPIDRPTLALLKAIPRPKTDPTNPYVFPSRRGRQRPGCPDHPDAWTHRFGRLARRLGLEGPDGPPWLHDLRRSFVTLSRRRGETERGIMNISGHKTREVFDRYDVYDLQEVIRFRKRQEAARRRELRAIAAKARRPAKRAPAPATGRRKAQAALRGHA